MSPQPLFLFSLPRSGSTLLQRMLGAHPDIRTVAEPWVLLPLLYALRSDGVYSEYHHKWCSKAIRDFCAELPEGENTYRHAVRDLVLRLYAQASPGNPRYFLDKSPPYSLIVSELLDLFPDARAIFLWHNPLSIVASVVESFGDGRWNVHRYKPELYAGLMNLTEAWGRHQDRCLSIRFEDLVEHPEDQCRRVTQYLGLEIEPRMVNGFSEVQFNGTMGDPTGRRRTEVSTESSERWKGTLAPPTRKAWCRKYLRWIGRDRLAVMGYDLAELLAELDAVPPWRSVVPRDLYDWLQGVVTSWVEFKPLRDKWRRRREPWRIFEHI